MVEREETQCWNSGSRAQQSAETLPQPILSAEPELMWRFFGLRVGRKTEVIALVAFVLSVSGVLWQVFNFARGPVVQLFPPDLVVFTSSNKLGRNYTDQENFLLVIATMAYTNEGDVGHNATIRREYAEISFGNRTVQHRWYEFGSSDIKDKQLDFTRDSEARPFPLNAGSATSHETLFTAWAVSCEDADTKCNPRSNFANWDEFMRAVKSNGKVLITIRALTAASKIATASCEVKLRAWETDLLEREQWVTVPCTELGEVPHLDQYYTPCVI